ncbi:hypothetical protein A8139_19535 [Marinomonas primoryensis]|uniref:Uncharacterized protein n=1 Tax=Marinomonas primoryensis TaxID=178399 RepID=A0A2Z4PWW3_9GAMM|nr:hypothetical protein [Marinomonas primoryensis]AWY01907.1 hypothetical protein A8139_19535 [Marinomonas primoryensis]
MKSKIAPWGAALFCAIFIHILIIEVSENQHWFDITPPASNFELFLLPTMQKAAEEPEQVAVFNEKEEKEAPSIESLTQQIEQPSTPPEALNGKQLSEKANTVDADIIELNQPTQNALEPNVLEPNTLDSSSFNQNALPTNALPNESSSTLDTKTTSENLFGHEVEASNLNEKLLNTDKPDLLDLSKISLSPDSSDDALEGVFSEELKDKIAVSKNAQQEYLKGQIKEISYPITKDSDGTRYVNIKGVCWRLPEPGSKEAWVIVFAGCSGQTKSFHFELNITPSTLLGPESPLSIGR